MSDFNTQVIGEFRANAGKVGGNFEGAPMVIITTTGDDERDRLFAAQIEVMRGFQTYADSTTRLIPVVALNHVG